MEKTKEINRGYLYQLSTVSLPRAAGEEPFHEKPKSLRWKFVAAVSGILPARIKDWLRPGWVLILSCARFIRRRVVAGVLRLTNQVVTTFVLVLTSIVLGTWLKMYLWVKGSRTAPLNARALGHVTEFIEQYPLHLYPIVLKSFQFAFLKSEVYSLVEQGARFAEMAIGEGTFSARIFPPDANVVGFDLSPYSLRNATQLPHVKQAVICDCLCPPINGGHFDVIVSNNFLHHVTMKQQTLANWSRVAKKLIFNESTPYWASGWAKPFMLKKVGFKSAAQRAVEKIKLDMLQDLEPKEALDELIDRDYKVIEVASYMSERTFFLCAVYSFIMRCSGPPTPQNLKSFFLNNYMRRLTLPVTTGIARMLIQFDQFQDRSRDAYVSYVCASRNASEPAAENYLLCPRCGGEISEADRCKDCEKQYSRMDEMLFLLPEEMEYVEKGYNPDQARLTPKEHL
jgi:ubiquinone/menaquinone biosynthesis C-methylase UbiE